MSNRMKLLSILAQTGLHKYTVNGEERQSRNIPGVLVGYPGLGKTQVLSGLGEDLAEKLQRDFPAEVFCAPQHMPEEVGGIPVPFYEAEEVRCLPMRIGKDLLKAGAGLFVIDEYSSADQAMGSACMTLLQDGRLGDLTLPPAVARFAAMNPPECAANGRALTAPESNRFCWIQWRLSFNDWKNYMMGGPGTLSGGVLLPVNWETKFGMKNRGVITAFLQRHLDLFDVSKTMPKPHDCNRPWPSPRSWENTSRLLAACESLGESPMSDLADLAVRGCVGDGAADSFIGWYKDMDIPDPEKLLNNVADAQEHIPVRPDKRQVALESVATAACQDHQSIVARWENAWRIISPTLTSQPDNALYAAKILAMGVSKVPGAEFPPEVLIVKDLLQKIGLTV